MEFMLDREVDNKIHKEVDERKKLFLSENRQLLRK